MTIERSRQITRMIGKTAFCAGIVGDIVTTGFGLAHGGTESTIFFSALPFPASAAIRASLIPAFFLLTRAFEKNERRNPSNKWLTDSAIWFLAAGGSVSAIRNIIVLANAGLLHF